MSVNGDALIAVIVNRPAREAGILERAEKMDIIENVRSWNRVRKTRNELYSLSNRDLADLGICRSDIPRVARNAVR